MFCSNNAALDTMATRLKHVDREVGETWEALRFRSIHTETSCLKQKAPSIHKVYESRILADTDYAGQASNDNTDESAFDPNF